MRCPENSRATAAGSYAGEGVGNEISTGTNRKGEGEGEGSDGMSGQKFRWRL